MKALVKNLGDQFNVPIDELETLNLEQFVDNAMKVEQGELATLRVSIFRNSQTFCKVNDFSTWVLSKIPRDFRNGSTHFAVIFFLLEKRYLLKGLAHSASLTQF